MCSRPMLCHVFVLKFARVSLGKWWLTLEAVVLFDSAVELWNTAPVKHKLLGLKRGADCVALMPESHDACH